MKQYRESKYKIFIRSIDSLTIRDVKAVQWVKKTFPTKVLYELDIYVHKRKL